MSNCRFATALSLPVLPTLLVATLACSSIAHAATTITVRPDSTGSSNADAFVTTGPSNNLTGNNYGAAGALAVSAPLSKGAFSSVIRMDVSSAMAAFNTAYGAGQWVIDSVVLELTSASPNNAIFNSPNAPGLFGVSWFSNDGWLEGTGGPSTPTTDGVRWSDIPGLTTGAQSLGTFSYNASGTSLYTLSPSAGLASDVLSGAQLSLVLTAADGAISAVLNSRNNGVAANRPALTITASAVPEPARSALLLMGVLAFILRRSRP